MSCEWGIVKGRVADPSKFEMTWDEHHYSCVGLLMRSAYYCATEEHLQRLRDYDAADRAVCGEWPPEIAPDHEAHQREIVTGHVLGAVFHLLVWLMDLNEDVPRPRCPMPEFEKSLARSRIRYR